MPKLADIPNVLRIDFQYTSTTIFGGNRTFWLYTSPANPSASQLNGVAAHIQAAWASFMAPMVSSTQSLTMVKITDLQSQQAFQGTNLTATPGTRSGGELPVDNCVLVNLVIGRRYRGGKPRIYLPGGVSTDTTDGRHWLPAFTTAMTTAWTNFSSQIASTNSGVTIASQACVHYYKNHTPNLSGSVWAPRNVPAPDPNAGGTVDYVGGFTVNPIIGQQRRRLRAVI